MTKKEQITAVARDLLADSLEGLTARQLMAGIAVRLPLILPSTVRQALFYAVHEGRIAHPAPKHYVLPDPDAPRLPGAAMPAAPRSSCGEAAFYAPLAAWLASELSLTRCIVLGGARLGDPCGTPDVLGRQSAPIGAVVPHADIFHAVEIKGERAGALDGVGQAVNYKRLAHKAYVAVPTLRRADLAQLSEVCVQEGLGLITFDAQRPAQPGFLLRLPARLGTPDPVLMNEKYALLKSVLW